MYNESRANAPPHLRVDGCPAVTGLGRNWSNQDGDPSDGGKCLPVHVSLIAGLLAATIATSGGTGIAADVFRICRHLFRSDVTLMLNRAFYPLDPHYTSSTGLLTALRIQYEFAKIRRHRVTEMQDLPNQ